MNLTGVPGRRTKFQSFDITQLKLEAFSFSPLNSSGEVMKDEGETNAENVRDVKLDEIDEDNVLLEQIQFTDGSVPPPHYSEYSNPPESKEEGTSSTAPSAEGTDQESDTLSILDQNIVLALCLDIKNTNPMVTHLQPTTLLVVEALLMWLMPL